MTALVTPALPDVEGDIRKAIEGEIKTYPVRSNWCSKLGHPCERHACYSRLDWDKVPKHSVETEMIFFGGRVLEKHVARTYLLKAGYDIVEEDRPIDVEKSGTLKKLQISGRLDFIIRKQGEKTEYPCEVKAMNQFLWEKIDSVEDMINSPQVWHRGYPAQLGLYLFGKDHETGLFLLINKSSFRPKVIWMQLNYEYTEQLLQKAGRINKHVAGGTYADRIPYSDDVCGRCDFATLCLKDIVRTEAQILADDGLITDLEERESLKKQASRYDELDKSVKKRLVGIPKGVAGDFMIMGKNVARAAYQVEAKEYWQVQIKKLSDSGTRNGGD